jgi:hypothetical protein
VSTGAVPPVFALPSYVTEYVGTGGESLPPAQLMTIRAKKMITIGMTFSFLFIASPSDIFLLIAQRRSTSWKGNRLFGVYPSLIKILKGEKSQDGLIRV